MKSDKKEEVMQIDHVESRRAAASVAPPPVEMAGGDMHKNPGKANMTDKERPANFTVAPDSKVSVPLPEPSCYYEGIPTAPLYEHKKLVAYGDERERAALARIAELEAKLAEAEQRLRGIADHCRDIYAIVPSLPVEPATMDAATDALHAFCLMLGIERIDIEPTYKTDAAIAAGGLDD